ncbi:MAG: acetyltransferase, partial [Chloroflexi bacterium]|nr:acetyltransferase [Chloroflexota bacterium]
MLSSTTRNGGRLLLSLADAITIVAPLFADWNGSHIFNERWPSHARFHGVVGLSTAVLLSGFGLVRLWTHTTQAEARDVAVAV